MSLGGRASPGEVLAVLAGHVPGLLIPASWTAAVGIDEDLYHWIAVGTGTIVGLVTVAGLAILLYRRSPSSPCASPRRSWTGPSTAGANRDMQVSATNSGFNLRVVLRKRPTSAPVYRLPVTGRGVRLAEGSDGGFTANDDDGETVFRIAPTMMWDRTQDGLEAVPQDTIPVEADLIEGADGGQVIELRPDFAWMSGPARVLPITVDPDTYVDSMGDKSTYVMSSAPTTSYGTASLVRAGYDSGIGKTRAYLQHTLPPRTSGQVSSAKLKLYQYDANSCTPTTLSIYPATSLWTQAMTWSGTNVGVDKQPSITTSAAYAVAKSFAHGLESGGCANATEEIDVTKMVSA